MTAGNREQLTGTIAKLSCIVGGLSRPLDKVRWTKSDNTDIRSGQDGYIIDIGTFKSGSQTTTLTVNSHQNNLDTTYNCVITSDEHDETDMSTTVNLNVFSKSHRYHDKQFVCFRTGKCYHIKVFFIYRL